MKGDSKVLAKLQEALTSELTGIHQYVLHAAMFESKHYSKLAGAVRQHSISEMKHADELIDRILFLEGTPNVTKPLEIKVGTGVVSMFENDLRLEKQAVKDYNAAIKVACEAGDNGSRDLLETHLKDEESHVDWLEAQLTKLKEMGTQNYLAAEQVA